MTYIQYHNSKGTRWDATAKYIHMDVYANQLFIYLNNSAQNSYSPYISPEMISKIFLKSFI